MTVVSLDGIESYNHFGDQSSVVRLLTVGKDGPDSGAGWTQIRVTVSELAASPRHDADAVLLPASIGNGLTDGQLRALADMMLPVILALDTEPTAALLDCATATVFPDDDADTLAGVFAHAAAPAAAPQLREFSEPASRTISALSVEARRIAEALARLAADEGLADQAPTPIDAGLIRRLIKLRRDRDRYFPAEIHADPAWDMLLDLIAARLEGKVVPVSSLCIAAAVPTTTALRWVRGLSEAGLFIRRNDPEDARRSHISLSDSAAEAMLAWLRLFTSQFAPRT